MKQWDFLQNAFSSGRIAHAYLLSGPEEAEVKKFTKEFTQFVYCLEQKKPCRTCQNCRMIEVGNFPDVTVIKSSQSRSSIDNEKDMMEISVDQIRYAQNFLSLTPYYGTWKIVIIEDAERMSQEAQHCFLKNLEEPKGHAMIFLQTSKPDMLLPTIASRCQELRFFYQGDYQVSPDEEKNFRSLQHVLGTDIAEKFKYAKNANLEREQFYRALNFLRKKLRQALLAALEKNDGVEKLKQDITLVEQMHRQALTSNMNYKLALEVLLLDLS